VSDDADPDPSPADPAVERCPCCDGTGHTLGSGDTEAAAPGPCTICGGSGLLVPVAA
jgi:hypothetical protein